MLPVLIAAFVAIGVLLWSDTTRSRLQGLLGRPGDGPDSGTEHRTGASSGRTGPPVADEQLACDLDRVAICLTSGLPLPVAPALPAAASEDRAGLRRLGRAMTIGGRKLAQDDRLLPVLEVLEFSEHTGGGPAPLRESVARELRDSSRRRQQEAAAALGVR